MKNIKILIAASLVLSSIKLFSAYKEVESEREFKELIKKYPYSIAAFHSPECPKCKIFMPAYRELGPKTDVMLIGVNIDKFMGLRNEYRVTSTPMVFLFDSKNNTKEPIQGYSKNVKEAIEKIKNLEKKQLTQSNSRTKRYVAYRNKRQQQTTS